MSQLENFRESLKKKPSMETTSRPALLPAKPKGDEREKVLTKANSADNRFKRSTIGVSGELHAELKALCFWMKKEGVKNNPGLTDVIAEMLDIYYKKHPDAKEFVGKFLE